MLSKGEQHFYNRHLLLDNIGEKGQLALKKAKVLVVGAGGLGCPVLTYLAGAGVGHIGIIDGDKVNISNLHRQTLYGHRHVGLNKSDAAIQQLKDMNPYIELKGYPEFLSPQNALSIFKNYDIIVDATDNFPARYLINDASVILGKPFVFASIDRFQGQLSVFNFNDGPTYRCVFPKPPKPETALSCSQVGVLGVLPGILGTLQANEIIKIIVDSGDVLSGKILMVDALKNNFFKLSVQRNKESLLNVLDLKSGVNNSDYYNFCNTLENSVIDISVEEVQHKMEIKQEIQFVDIRDEQSNGNIANSIKIPFSKIEKEFGAINKDAIAILYCDQGITSRIAAEKLYKYGLKNVYSLKGGLRAWNSMSIKSREI